MNVISDKLLEKDGLLIYIGEGFTKCLDVLDTCTTSEHLDAIINMCNNFIINAKVLLYDNKWKYKRKDFKEIDNRINYCLNTLDADVTKAREEIECGNKSGRKMGFGV